MVHLRVMYSYRCNMTDVYVTLDWVLWMCGGGICLTNESRGTNLRSALILGLIAVNAFQWRLRRCRQPHAETRWIHSSLPLLSVIMKFYSSARAWRLRNIKDIIPAQLQIEQEWSRTPHSPPSSICCFSVFISFCLYCFCFILGPKIPFPVPICLTFWFPWTNASLSSKSFFPFFSLR